MKRWEKQKAIATLTDTVMVQQVETGCTHLAVCLSSLFHLLFLKNLERIWWKPWSFVSFLLGACYAHFQLQYMFFSQTLIGGLLGLHSVLCALNHSIFKAPLPKRPLSSDWLPLCVDVLNTNYNPSKKMNLSFSLGNLRSICLCLSPNTIWFTKVNTCGHKDYRSAWYMLHEMSVCCGN